MRAVVFFIIMVVATGCGSRSAPFRPAVRDGAALLDRLIAGEAVSPRFDRGHPGERPRDRPRPDALLAPCTGKGSTLLMTVSSQMAVCRTPESWIDQCGASKVCGLGWRLCGASEYRVHFASTPPPTETTWIGACVRSAGIAHAPTDQACAECPTSLDLHGLDGWTCFKDGGGTAQRSYVAVASHPDCYRVGVNSPSTAAYWSPITPDYKLRQAFCCKGG